MEKGGSLKNLLQLILFRMGGLLPGVSTEHEKPLEPKGCIENQMQGELSKLSYGRGDISRNGCGIVAVYNAYYYLGLKTSFMELLSWFEAHGEVLWGQGGVSPGSMRIRFQQDPRLETRALSRIDKNRTDAFERQARVFVLLTAPENRFFFMHYITIVKEGKLWRMVNALYPYEKKESLYETVRAYNRGASAPLLLYGLSLKPGDR